MSGIRIAFQYGAKRIICYTMPYSTIKMAIPGVLTKFKLDKSTQIEIFYNGRIISTEMSYNESGIKSNSTIIILTNTYEPTRMLKTIPLNTENVLDNILLNSEKINIIKSWGIAGIAIFNEQIALLSGNDTDLINKFKIMGTDASHPSLSIIKILDIILCTPTTNTMITIPTDNSIPIKFININTISSVAKRDICYDFANHTKARLKAIFNTKTNTKTKTNAKTIVID